MSDIEAHSHFKNCTFFVIFFFVSQQFTTICQSRIIISHINQSLIKIITDKPWRKFTIVMCLLKSFFTAYDNYWSLKDFWVSYRIGHADYENARKNFINVITKKGQSFFRNCILYLYLLKHKKLTGFRLNNNFPVKSYQYHSFFFEANRVCSLAWRITCD